MKKFILLVLLISSRLCYSQTDIAVYSNQDSSKIKSERIFAIGIIFEMLFEQQHEFQTQREYKEISNGFITDGFSFGAAGKFLIADKTILEFRPEITWLGYLIGIDGGIFLRRMFTKRLFGIVGLNLHGTARFSSGGNSGWATRSGWFLYPGASLGVKVAKSLSFIFSAYKASIGNYYNSYSAMDGRRVQADLKWLFKVGVEFGPEF